MSDVTTTFCEWKTTVTQVGPTQLPFTSIDSSGEVLIEYWSQVPQSASTEPGVQCSQVLLAPNFIPYDGLNSVIISPTAPAALVEATSTPSFATGTAFATSTPAFVSAGPTSTSQKNIVGPVVGSVVGALAIAGLAGLYVIIRRRRRQQRAAEERPHWSTIPGKWSFGFKEEEQPQEQDKIAVTEVKT